MIPRFGHKPICFCSVRPYFLVIATLPHFFKKSCYWTCTYFYCGGWVTSRLQGQFLTYLRILPRNCFQSHCHLEMSSMLQRRYFPFCALLVHIWSRHMEWRYTTVHFKKTIYANERGIVEYCSAGLTVLNNLMMCLSGFCTFMNVTQNQSAKK